MTTHPVQMRVEPTGEMARIHVVVRLAVLMALGMLGWSSIYWLLYLGLPVIAALLVSSDGPEIYLTEDAAPMKRALGWLAAAYAYLWLLTDEFPTGRAPPRVELSIEPDGRPTVASALARLLFSIPAVLILAILSIPAGVVWLLGAIVILVRRRMPSVLADFLALTLLYQFRLAAYHLSLVERYPSLEPAPYLKVRQTVPS